MQGTHLLDSISVPRLDVDIHVPGLVSDVLNSNAARNFARLGGSKKTLEKRPAARANGRKGGGPKNCPSGSNPPIIPKTRQVGRCARHIC